MKEKILIVDDDVNICTLIKEALDKEKKYEIFVENDSDDALETADKRFNVTSTLPLTISSSVPRFTAAA